LEVDEALLNLLPGVDDGVPAALADAMRYSITAGGKRLRPILCLASAEAVGGDHRRALPVACALEMIHTYSLIHDDLPAMDNDSMRRGQPTLHVVAGEGMAILAGDGLLTHAFHLLAMHAPHAVSMVADAAGPRGMVGGQAIDLLTAPLDAAGLQRMHQMKTGALIRASATCGAVAGGGTPPQAEAIDRAAAKFGLAFQIVDDILDVEGASAQLGKTAGKDAAAGKPTYPALYGLERSRAMARECLERADEILAAAGLADSRLPAIGRWIVERSN